MLKNKPKCYFEILNTTLVGPYKMNNPIKVRILIDDSCFELEGQINDCIQDIKDCDVVDIKYEVFEANDKKIFFTAMILYR